MRYSLLGPLQVMDEDGAEVEVPGTLRRTLLAVLLLNAGSTVSADRLAELLWSSDADSARGARLHNQILRLRRSLDDHSGSGPIRAAATGYLIEVADGELDLHRFAAHSAEARRAAASGDWTKASAEYAAGLAQWRGAPLEDLPALAEEPVIQRLDEERWAALQGRIEADLNLGRHTEVVAELRTLTQEQPLREGLHAQLMLALYQDGQQTEALDVFDALSRKLGDDAGLEPGSAMSELRERILRQDPALAPRAGAPLSSAPAASRPSRNQLPADTRLFTGRASEVERLLALAREASAGGQAGTVTISALDGLGGIGKSALAVRIAHRVSGLFPDGQLFVDLRGNAKDREPLPSLAALGQLLRSLDVPQQQIPADLAEGSALLRERLDGTKTLILLDNAADGAQVRPLLPDAPGCLVFVTSRGRLAGVEGAHQLRLDLLSEAESVALLRAGAGPGRIPPDEPALAELAELCGRIPLALRIVAARLRYRSTLTVLDLVAELRDERGRLNALHDEDRDVADVLGTSYADLAEPEQRAFRLLGLVPGTDVDAHAAAALLDRDLHGTERLFGLLVDRNLLMEATPGRFRMHDLVRLYAAGRTGAKEYHAEREEALDRLVLWYAYTAKQASRTVDMTPRRGQVNVGDESITPLGFESPQDAITWYDRESANLRAASAVCRATGRPELGLQLTDGVSGLLQHRGDVRRWLEETESGIGFARELADRLAECHLSRSRAAALLHLGRREESLAAIKLSLSLAQEVGDESAEANALVGLSATYGIGGQVDESVAAGARAVALFERLGSPERAVGGLINMAAGLSQVGRDGEALPLIEKAVRLCRGTNSPHHLSACLANYAAIMHSHGDYDPAVLDATYREATEANRSIGNSRYELKVLLGYGVFLEETGRDADAVRVLEEAERLGIELAEPIHDKARDTLTRARAAVSAATATATATATSDS